jgi:hypothetical protein
MLKSLNILIKRSFARDTEAPESIPHLLIRQTLLMVAVVVVALVLKPDLFGVIPNSLDPMFYTGYSINLDDALAAGGNGHYFVTRWSSYLPQYFMCQIFGPYWGRIALRLFMLAVISEVFWRIGRRFRFTTSSRVAAFMFVIFMPMFVRAFTTDYQEYASLFYGVLLASIVFTQKQTFKWCAGFGVLSALLAISNPFNAGIIVLAGIVWVVREFTLKQIPQLVPKICVSVLASFATILLGYVLFRYHYGIENIYKPTLDFIQNYKSSEIDLWTAPNKSWIGHFGWLYLPVFMVIFSRRFINLDDTNLQQSKNCLELLVFLVLGFHVYMQVTRGHALETSYYWAMALPPFYILAYLFIGYFASKFATVWPTALMFIVVILLILLKAFDTVHFGANHALWAALVCFAVGACAVARFKNELLLPFVILGLFWFQLGSPPYTQLTYGGDSNTPRYDLVYGEQAKSSDQILRETIWFTNQMDKVDEDWKSTFLTDGGRSAAIVGSYVPHPFSRWIIPVTPEVPIPLNVRDELEFGRRKYLVIYDEPYKVSRLLAAVENQLTRSKVLLDEKNTDGLKYRLLVLLGNSESVGYADIPVGRLNRNIGQVAKDGSVVVASGTPNGFASFGPFFSLGAGKYRAVLNIESESIGDVGIFEVFNDRSGKSVGARIKQPAPGNASYEVNFSVGRDDTTWQLRTQYTGEFEVRFINILLERQTKDE